MPRRISFQTIVVGVILGLIVASTASTTWLAASGFQSVTRSLLDKQIAITLDAVTAQIEALFAPADRLLHTFATQIQTGTLPVENPARLAQEFADALRFERGVAWISFGYPDGRFAGTWIDGGERVINLSTPGGGPPAEWKLDAAGRWTAWKRPDLPASFDARSRLWFQRAIEGKGISWTPPYEFASRGRGITASLAVRAADGRLIGVLTVDFFLRDIATYLESLRTKFRGDSLVFSLQGSVIATPRELRSGEAVDFIRHMLSAEDMRTALRGPGGGFHEEVTIGDGRYLVGAQLASVRGDLDCVSIMVFDRREIYGTLDRVIAQSVVAAGVALLVSLVAGFVLASRIADPLRALSSQVVRIGTFDLTSAPVPRSRVREVHQLSDAVERMRAGLKSFSHYVPVDLVRDLVLSGGVAERGGQRREITVLFADLVGFTTFAETCPPELAFAALSQTFDRLGAEIDAQGGVIDKFIGDGVMALFDAPQRIADPEASACRAALRGLASLREVRVPGGPALDARIGLFRDEVLVGNVGTAARFSYTAIGDGVNIASRLEALNKRYGTHILAGASVREGAGDDEFVWRWLDRVSVAGRQEPLDIHELVGLRSSLEPSVIACASRYERGFRHLLAGGLGAAAECLAAGVGTDGPSRLLLARIERMRSDPTDGGWGVTRFETK